MTDFSNRATASGCVQKDRPDPCQAMPKPNQHTANPDFIHGKPEQDPCQTEAKPYNRDVCDAAGLQSDEDSSSDTDSDDPDEQNHHGTSKCGPQLIETRDLLLDHMKYRYSP